ncbi:ANTAR domain-containing protein [Arthrobacter sp. MDT3-44]
MGSVDVGSADRDVGAEGGLDGWNSFRAAARALHIASVMTVVLDLEDEGVAVFSFYAADSNAFPAGCRQVAEAFAGVAARSLQLVLRWGSTTQREANLRAALESRTVIDLALGMIMAQNRCTHEQAISILKRASNTQNTRLHTIAERIVHAYNPDPPTTHFTN